MIGLKVLIAEKLFGKDITMVTGDVPQDTLKPENLDTTSEDDRNIFQRILDYLDSIGTQGNPTDESTNNDQESNDTEDSSNPDESDTDTDTTGDSSSNDTDNTDDSDPIIFIDPDIFDPATLTTRDNSNREGQFTEAFPTSLTYSLFNSVNNTSSDKRALIIQLDTIKINNDQDFFGNGDIQVITAVKTGNIIQKTASPYVNWYEADGGDTIEISKPIFVLPEDQLGGKITLLITVVDNDELPTTAKGLLNLEFDIGSYITGISYNDTAQDAIEYAKDKQNSFLDWIGGSDLVGNHVNQFFKSNNYGFTTENEFKTFSKKDGDMEVVYRMHRERMPKQFLKVDVTLKNFQGYETGDNAILGEGDIFIWNQVSDGFDSNGNMSGQAVRFPQEGYQDIADGDNWNINKSIYSGITKSPVLFIESGVWDSDDTSNDDQVVIYNRIIKLSGITQPTTFNIMRSTSREVGLDASGEVSILVKVTPVE